MYRYKSTDGLDRYNGYIFFVRCAAVSHIDISDDRFNL